MLGAQVPLNQSRERNHPGRMVSAMVELQRPDLPGIEGQAWGSLTRHALRVGVAQFGRALWALIASLVMLTLINRRSSAEELAVPARVHAELVAKLASYDRNFLDRAGKTAVIGVVVKASDADSVYASTQIEGMLKKSDLIGGLPHEEIVIPWNGARDLANQCVKHRMAIIYLTPGLMGEMDAVARELTGKNVLTVAAVLGFVAKGAVLGFELVSGRPKMVINIAQAKKQHVEFRADVLNLMRIVE